MLGFDSLNVLPDYRAKFEALYTALWNLPQIPGPVLELCRLRLAQLHHSDVEWQRQECPVTAQQREHLSRWDQHPAFSDAERACLSLTEVYAMDPQAITDEQADAVKTHFGEAGFVALVEALGLFDGLTRLGLLWHDMPEAESTQR